jgi:precorrin-2 C20-methyltransferase / precorrin-3B C17-methyltransferase
VAILKVSRNVDGIRDALAAAGRLDEAVYVRRASHVDQTVEPFAGVDASDVPYMATVLVPGRVAAGRAPTVEAAVVVVGLGPAGPDWLTPQASFELTAATDIVGYGTYMSRVPVRAGQRRHATDNRVENERATFALDLARSGRRVAVVSSGDPGVFAMASAVFEARTDDYEDVPVSVVPGVTAANAVAARVGAPLGHDFCTLSLSDQLKPWDVVLRRLDAAAAADFVLALYNPASRSRDRRAEVRDVLLRHRDPATPVVVARAVGHPEERIDLIRLDELAEADVDMRTLLLVGSSRTVASAGTVWTPRRY